jgi:hypothetical protein
MFSHDTLEATNNRVVITDFDFQTMQELLRYIYCEHVLNLNLKEVALDLLQAADKVSKIFIFFFKESILISFHTVSFVWIERNLRKIVGEQHDR